MLSVYTAEHLNHRPAAELIEGAMAPAVEVPERAELVRAAVEDASIGAILPPEDRSANTDAVIAAIHDPKYVAFLETAHDEWRSDGRAGDALPYVWPTRWLRQIEPESIDGRLSYYSFDAGTPITAGSWTAMEASARVAITAARLLLRGEQAVFAMCRPPGHHAARDLYGGYCFLNNAALACHVLRQGGADRVAVIDVDYHAGNGTQAIFYERGDVLTCSIHADPKQEYPYFLGHADESGAGEGVGANVNLPLPWGTGWKDWSVALRHACGQVSAFGADALVVSLGVDTFRADPICKFLLDTPDYLRAGALLGTVGLPTVFVLEGGYALDGIGENVVNVLRGFDDGAGG